MVLQVILGTNDDDEYTVRVTRRIARRLGAHEGTDVPGHHLPRDRRARAPDAARGDARRQRAEHGQLDRRRRLPPRRVGDRPVVADRARARPGSCSGSNENIPAFRWVEKENGRMLVCSSPSDCAEIESRHATGIGLLIDGGASRGNLLSGEAEDVILTVSRTEAERKANPGYRAFLANGFNVTRALVLFLWEIGLEVIGLDAGEAARRAAARASRRHLSAAAGGDVRDRARSHRLRRADRHDARAAGGLRHLLELRRGGPSLRADAGRHARGAAQARPAVRPPRRRPALRPAPVRDRRAVGPRADPGRDVQAAQRLRARRAGRALARPGARGGLRRRRRAGRDGGPRRRRGDGAQGEEAPEE